jgi:hypothetical protein
MLDALHGLTKTGEGFGRPGGESSLPIDINYAKLVEWLVRPSPIHTTVLRSINMLRIHACDSITTDRRISHQVDRKQLPADWRKRLRLIEAKAAELPQPDRVLVRMLTCGFWCVNNDVSTRRATHPGLAMMQTNRSTPLFVRAAMATLRWTTLRRVGSVIALQGPQSATCLASSRARPGRGSNSCRHTIKEASALPGALPACPKSGIRKRSMIAGTVLPLCGVQQ